MSGIAGRRCGFRVRAAVVPLLAAVAAGLWAGAAFGAGPDGGTGLPVFAVERSGRSGFADAQGRVVIDPIYEKAKDFRAGLAAVRTRGRWGYIDALGRFAIRPQFEDASDFSEGLAAVSMDDKWGYVDREGKTVQPRADFEDDRSILLGQFERWTHRADAAKKKFDRGRCGDLGE